MKEMNDWIIIPFYQPHAMVAHRYWALYKLGRLISQQTFALDKYGQVRTFTTRSGARGVRSRLRHSGGEVSI